MWSFLDLVVLSQLVYVFIKILFFHKESIINELSKQDLQGIHLLKSDPTHFGVVHILVELIVVVFGGQHNGWNQQPEITIYKLMHTILVQDQVLPLFLQPIQVNQGDYVWRTRAMRIFVYP